MSFVDFLKLINPRFFQERDVGLDLYLSGPWGWTPAVLAIVSATVFLLALFHIVPTRRHSVPLLLVVGVVGLLVGIAGSSVNFSAYPLSGDGPWPRIVTDGAGRTPDTESQLATLLSLPLLAGAVGVAESLGCAVFLLVFGGGDGARKQSSDGDGR